MQTLQRGTNLSLFSRPTAVVARQKLAQKQSRVVVTRADQNIEQGLPTPKLPKGATEPPVSPELPPPWFGFVDRAERLNSRAAMIGFFALIAVEAIFGRGLLDLLGFNTGNGLPFEL